MKKGFREEICPVCHKKAVVTKKWVKNRYGMRYDYVIYSHDKLKHYVNHTTTNTRKYKKGELERIIIEVLSSESFKEGVFTVNDVVEFIGKKFENININSLRSNLFRLSDLGIIESTKRGRKVFFLNTINKSRLNFLFDSIEIYLEDAGENLLMEKHTHIITIRNDKPWPINYIQSRIVGDVDEFYENLGLKVFDLSISTEIKTILIEDKPREKRVLLKLPLPLGPNESRKIKMEYNWAEPEHSFVSSAATQINGFTFSISCNIPLNLTVTETSSTRNDVKDLSGKVIKMEGTKWKLIYTINFKRIEPFSVIQIKWSTQ
jgi:Fe2+ or Zn2+ uptake regulation protein